MPDAPQPISADSPEALALQPIAAPATPIAADSPEAASLVPQAAVAPTVPETGAATLVSPGDYLKMLPRDEIVQEYLKADSSGGPVDKEEFYKAYEARAHEGNLFGDVDRRPGEPPSPSLLKRAYETGTSLMEGFFTQSNELGKFFTARDIAGGRANLDQRERAAGLWNVTKAAQLASFRSADTLRLFAVNTANYLFHHNNFIAQTEGINNESPNARDSALFREQFDTDVKVKRAEDTAASGAPVFAKPDDSTAAVQNIVDPDVVQKASMSPLSDPAFVLPFAAASKAVTAAEAFKSLELAGAAEKSAFGPAGKYFARPLELAANATRATAEIADKSPLVRAGVAGAATLAAGGNAPLATLAALVGANSGKTELLQGILGGAENTLRANAGKLAGREALGPMGKFAAFSFRAATDEGKALLLSQAPNLPFLLGTENRKDAENFALVGLLAHGAGKGVGKIVSGLNVNRNFWAPYTGGAGEPRLATKDLGVSPTLDAEHAATMSGINDSGSNFIEGWRNFLKKTGVGEFYAVSPDGLKSGLQELATASGKSVEDLTGGFSAADASQHNGFQVSLADEKGAPRRVAFAVIKDGVPGVAAGHEIGHVILDSMSDEQKAGVRATFARDYGIEQVDNFRKSYAQKLGVDPSSLPDSFVLDELAAETASAVLNSVPVHQFGPAGAPGWSSTVRNVYGWVGQALSNAGIAVPEAAKARAVELPDGSVRDVWTGAESGPTGKLGANPSIPGARLIENYLQSLALDKGAFAPDAATEAAQTPESPIADARVVPNKPIFKVGDPLDTVSTAGGSPIAHDAEVTKVLGDRDGVHYYEIEYTDPADGKRKRGNVPESYLLGPEKVESTPTAGTATPPAAESARTTATPKPAETVARPQGEEKPNVHVTPGQQEAFATKATPEVAAHNTKLVQAAAQLPTAHKQAFETDYYSAKGNTGEDATVRGQRRALADAAEKTGKPNPLRSLYQKIFVPYRFIEGKTPRVFGFSYDKLIQNVDILKGWAQKNGRGDLVNRLSAPHFPDTVRTYLQNQSNGFGGGGESLKRPSDARPGSITPEAPGFTPTALPKTDTQLVNFLMGVEQPSASSPGSRFAARMARENGLSTPLNENGVEITNPLHAELTKKGFDPALLNSTVENLPVDRMTTKLKPRPDLNVTANDLGITRAGFMPGSEPERTQGNQNSRDIARDYMSAHGIKGEPHTGYARPSEETLKNVADFYEEAKHDPQNPEVQKSYKALAQETVAQYRAMQKAGIQIEPYSGKGEPYKNSAEMMQDVRDNKHLYFLKTENAFGEADALAQNPLLAPSGITSQGHKLLLNDVFRAVHDYFGHTAEGYEFGPRGEYNAYLAHSRMFSDEAKPALAAETLAQNAWVNFGSHMRRPDGSIPKIGDADFVSVRDRKFAEQKNTTVPSDLLDRIDREARKSSEPRVGDETEKQDFSGDKRKNSFRRGDEVVVSNSARTERGQIGTITESVNDPIPRKRLLGGTGEHTRHSVRLGDGKTVELYDWELRKRSEPPSTGHFQPAANGEALPHSVGEGDLDLVHYGQAGQKTADPKFFGQSGMTPRSELSGMKRAYFYEAGKVNKSDPVVKSRTPHEATVDAGRIYDGDTDVLDHGSTINREKADQMLIDAGYKGIARTGGSGKSKYRQVELFEPTKLSKPGRFQPAGKTDSPEFKEWFGESKIVDNEGKPLVMFHGTRSKFTEFETPAYFTEDRQDAQDYAHGQGGDRPQIIPAYLNLKNPKVIEHFGDFAEMTPKDVARLISEGHDGVVLKKLTAREPTMAAVFNPEQVKSATRNRGTFDATNPDIRFQPQASPAQEKAFQDSTVRDESGKLRPLFHGTHSDFKKFGQGDLGYHFGTEKAANERIGKALADVFPEQVDAHRAFEAFPEIRGSMPPASRGALEGLVDGARTLPTFLDLKNPLRMRDVGPWDNPEEVLFALPPKVLKELPKSVGQAVDAYKAWENDYSGPARKFDDAKAPQAKKALTAIREGLKSIGYDGVVYKNEFEGKDGNDSYIAFDNKQIMAAFAHDAKARFMPAKPRPGAEEWITAAALEDGQGKIHTGLSHAAIFQKHFAEDSGNGSFFERDGFVTNRGRFVSREDAKQIADKAGQLDEPTYTERANAANWPDQKDKLEANAFREARRFMPAAPKAGAEDWIRSAAIQNKAGDTLTGESHAEIIYNAQQNEDWEDFSKAGFHDESDGFVTEKGKFVNRDEAWKIARKAGQIDAENYLEAAKGKRGVFGPGTTARDVVKSGLEAVSFEGSRKFMPGDEDVRDTRTYRNIAKHLTPDEAGGIRRDTAQKLVDLYKELPADEDFETASKAGSIKRGWYQRAADTLRFIFGDDTERFVSLLAATSPRQTVQENMRMAMNIWADWQDAGRPLHEADLKPLIQKHAEMHSRVPNSIRALQGYENAEPPKSADTLDPKAQLSGPKVDSFRRNLLGDLSASTNDAWMAMFSNIDQSKFSTKSGYLAMNAKIRKTAAKLDLHPAEVQETIWSFFKTLREATSVDRGAKEALRSLSDSDILNTPEFHEQLLSDPKVHAQLERLGFDFAAFDRRSHPQRPVPRTGSLADLAAQEGGERGARVLDRIAGRAQRLHDLEIAQTRKTLAENQDDNNPF